MNIGSMALDDLSKGQANADKDNCGKKSKGLASDAEMPNSAKAKVVCLSEVQEKDFLGWMCKTQKASEGPSVAN
jgi:hypothetical protein